MQPEQTCIPIGWTFNPSARAHRYRLSLIAGCSFLIVLYLALCQIGILGHAWDPVFFSGTDHVIHSSISKALPVPDAAVGAGVYLLEILLLVAGSDDRWLTQPWLVILSQLTNAALLMASVVLTFLQPVIVGAWCTGCLVTFGLVLLLLQRSIPELLASIQSVILTSRYGAKTRSKLVTEFGSGAAHPFHPWTVGTSCPWTLLASALVGAVILALPDLAQIDGIAKGTLELSGIIVLSSSVIAMSEPLRFLRLVNVAAGLLPVFWYLGQPLGASRWMAMILGMAAMTLSIYRGKITESYGLFSSTSATSLQAGSI